MEIAVLIVLILIFVAATIGVIIGVREFKKDRQLKALRYVSEQMDTLAKLGAREEMRRLGDGDILKYVGEDAEKTQKLLQYPYVFNRLGEAVKNGLLDATIIFKVWLPIEFFVANWKKVEPLVKKERKRRKIPNLYDSAEWLAKYAEQFARK